MTINPINRFSVRFGAESPILTNLPSLSKLIPGKTTIGGAQEMCNACEKLTEHPELVAGRVDVFEGLGDLVEKLDHTAFQPSHRPTDIGLPKSQRPLLQSDAIRIKQSAVWTIGVLNAQLKTQHQVDRLKGILAQMGDNVSSATADIKVAIMQIFDPAVMAQSLAILDSIRKNRKVMS